MALEHILIFLASTSLGYGCYRVGLVMVPRLLNHSSKALAKNIIQEARLQQQHVLAQKSNIDSLSLEREELEEDLASLKSSLQEDEQLLAFRQKEQAEQEKRLQRRESLSRKKEETLQAKRAKLVNSEQALEQSQLRLCRMLEEKSRINAEKLRYEHCQQIVQRKQIEYQKTLKFMEAEMQASAKKRAELMLADVHARYAPQFVWPKASRVVMGKQSGQISSLLSTHPHLVEELEELSGASIKIVEEQPKSQSQKEKEEEDSSSAAASISGLKFGGGFGIHRESAMLAFQDILNGESVPIRIKPLYQKYLAKLNHQARALGRQAVQDLQLPHVHPEIQYLIGALNWRTSYRQNQWLHTMEVAVLAGILASELHVDPQAAKRCGLLHDIGKAIDYRIEGSHAIISGDYADRYGESKEICDTVMSHHEDLIVDTPLAYTLMTADTLSGARPGARVNIEEGYQLRLTHITETIRSFPGVSHLAIMNGGREVHIRVNHKTVSEQKARDLASEIARKIEDNVSYPSQIKVQVSRIYESQSVA